MHDGVGERPWLPGDMTKPLEFSFSDGLQEGLINADLVLNSSRHFNVGYSLLPCDSQDSSEAAKFKRLDSVLDFL